MGKKAIGVGTESKKVLRDRLAGFWQLLSLYCYARQDSTGFEFRSQLITPGSEVWLRVVAISPEVYFLTAEMVQVTVVPGLSLRFLISNTPPMMLVR